MTAAQLELGAGYRLAATACAICHRALKDAASVERGIGPECARKYGAPSTLTEAERREANELTHLLALHASGAQGIDAGAALIRLHAMGCWRLAEACARVVAAVTIQEAGAALVVRCPYVAESRREWRALDGHRWDADLRADVVVSSARLGVWRILRRHYGGAIGVGPRGPFVIQPFESKGG